jgi:secreted PhoX family phosphatase
MGLRQVIQNGGDAVARAAAAANPRIGYGPLVPDPKRLLDLPAGFGYQAISRAGDKMDDGCVVPGLADGMATFAAPDGLAIIIRNHEMLPWQEPGPFGAGNRLLETIDPAKLYDRGARRTPHRGGTTTIVFDTKRQLIVRQFLSLAGTSRNCAGGPTPWNSWISCEETVIRAGHNVEVNEDKKVEYECDRDHGYCFDVPATAKRCLADPIPLTAMGRFYHEAVAVDPRTGIVYETEDREDGLFYRFLPNRPGALAAGGRLQALVVQDLERADTRNWRRRGQTIDVGAKLRVRWMDMDHVESPEDDLRSRGHDAGAARFARAEGIWHDRGQFFFACTNGGSRRKGQIWRYIPADQEGQGGEVDSGTLELFIESHDSALLESADNLTMSPWGDLIVCEDRTSPIVRLVGVTPAGELYTLAGSHARCEFAGVCFTPDGSTLLVNIQQKGLTIAVTGPWRTLA